VTAEKHQALRAKDFDAAGTLRPVRPLGSVADFVGNLRIGLIGTAFAGHDEIAVVVGDRLQVGRSRLSFGNRRRCSRRNLGWGRIARAAREVQLVAGTSGSRRCNPSSAPQRFRRVIENGRSAPGPEQSQSLPRARRGGSSFQGPLPSRLYTFTSRILPVCRSGCSRGRWQRRVRCDSQPLTIRLYFSAARSIGGFQIVIVGHFST
jgi:hypothetical protein